jgi:hypothetical protein
MSAGDLVIDLHEIWGTRWLVDRLIALTRGVETDWAEFKATICPPAAHIDRYSSERGSGPKYVKGDYYLNVVKSVVSFMNSHGGVVLLGVAQERGSPPVPADPERLCESPEHAPVPLNDVHDGWDSDKWLLYVRNVLKHNEWTDRYGTIWNCSVVLDDPYVRLFNGVFRARPVIVIAVLPISRPAELRPCVTVGRRACQAQASPDRKSCHWPHAAPEELRPSVVPFRVAGDTASVMLKWSFADVAIHLRHRRSKQERFARIVEEELEKRGALPYGLLPAVDSVLARTNRRAKQFAVADGRDVPVDAFVLRDDKGNVRLTDSLHRRQSPRHIACLTSAHGQDAAFAARICEHHFRQFTFGSVLPVLVSLDQDLNQETAQLLTDEPNRLAIPALLQRFGTPTCGNDHWEYIAHHGGLHVVIHGVSALQPRLQARLMQAAIAFQEDFTDCAVTLIGVPGVEPETALLSRYQIVARD